MEQDSRISKLEKIKETIKNEDFKKVIEDKIKKISNSKIIIK